MKMFIIIKYFHLFQNKEEWHFFTLKKTTTTNLCVCVLVPSHVQFFVTTWTKELTRLLCPWNSPGKKEYWKKKKTLTSGLIKHSWILIYVSACNLYYTSRNLWKIPLYTHERSRVSKANNDLVL